MATVQDLGTDSLLEIGVLAAGETMGADDSGSLLRTLNRMVNAWKAERVYIYTLTRTTWTIVSGDGSYTVGSGGNVNVLRPVHIDGVSIIDTAITPNVEVPLDVMTDQAWVNLRVKTQTATQPTSAYYNLTYPTATLELWPVPTSATLTGVLYAPQAAAEFTAITETVSLPPGYERMIVKNLALELCPSYGIEPSTVLQRQAQDALAVVLRSNKRRQEQLFDPGAAMHSPSYDIQSDQG